MSRIRFAALLSAVGLLAACGGGEAGEDTAADGDGTEAAAADWEPEFVDGVLQPLPDGFPDRPITIVVADEAASAEGIQVTHLQQAAEGISPVAIELSARTDFAGIPTWEAIAYVNGTEDGREGYELVNFATVGSLADIGAIDVEGTTGVTLDDVTEVVTTENTRWFVSQCTEVAWEPTMESLVAYTQEHPGEVRFMGQGGVGGSDLGFFSYLDALEAGEINVIPVGGGTEKTTATAACEGDVTIATVETTLPHFQAGRLDLIMVNGEERIEDFPDVPSAADIGIDGGGLVSSKQLVAASEVPALHVQWLYELFNAILADPTYIENREELPGVVVGVRDPAQSEADNLAALETVEATLRDLGLHFDQTGGETG